MNEGRPGSMSHRGTIGPQVSLDEVECPPGTSTFNYHCALKSDDQYLTGR